MRVIIAVALACLSSPAFSQWHYQGEESAFGDGGMHVAMTGNGHYVFGIRCETGEMTALLVTPEDMSASDAATMQMTFPRLMFRVDKNAPLEFGSTMESYNGKLRLSAEIDRSVADQIAQAKQRVSVAVSALGQLFHEQRFNVAGSTRAVQQLLKGCGVE